MTRLLQEMHIRKWIRLKRPALTPNHAYQRLTWAQRYRHFRYLNWRRVRWSDECSIELGNGQKLEWVFIHRCYGIRLRSGPPDFGRDLLTGYARLG